MARGLAHRGGSFPHAEVIDTHGPEVSTQGGAGPTRGQGEAHTILMGPHVGPRYTVVLSGSVKEE